MRGATERHMSRPIRGLLYISASLGLVLVGWWAGRTALIPPDDPLAVSVPVTYKVSSGEVGRSLSFSAVAEWQGQTVGHQAASGVVTTIDIVPGEMVQVGMVLYTVSLRPVIAAVGEVPSFRDLSAGAEGKDVRQLEDLLVSLGFLDVESDNLFGAATASAVREWHRTLGVSADAIVRAGDVVFLPSLPARMSLAEGIVPGSRLGGGEQILLQLPDEPSVRIPLLVEQRDLVPLSAKVFVTHSEGRWEGLIAQAVETPQGELDLILTSADGGPICGTDCQRFVAFEGRTAFSAEIVVVPRVVGLLVPVAAIKTDPSGEAFVTLSTGDRVLIEIVASAGGLAVVEGVVEGEEIIIQNAVAEASGS